MPLAIDAVQQLPLCCEVDVLVVGGGPAGIAAAIAAARSGVSVLLVEQFNCLGGVAGAGGHGHISIFCAWGDRTRVAGGVIYDLARRLVLEDAGWMNHHGVWFEVEKLKYLLERMMAIYGVRLLYHTFFCETVMAKDTVVGAVIQNKSGRQLVKARRIIDCSGDGDVAASAGAPFALGRPGDGKCQPATLMFTIGGVEWPRVEAWRSDYPMRHVWEEAQRNGDMEPFQSTIMGFSVDPHARGSGGDQLHAHHGYRWHQRGRPDPRHARRTASGVPLPRCLPQIRAGHGTVLPGLDPEHRGLAREPAHRG